MKVSFRTGASASLSLIGTGARVHDLKDVEAILDVFQAHGHYEVRMCVDPFP